MTVEIVLPMNTTERYRGSMLNKVPEITVYFWIIKILCTTIGESAADWLNVTLGFGLGPTTLVTLVLLAVVMVVQFRLRRYVPAVYWTAVALISVVGTLLTDNLTDKIGVDLLISTSVFLVLLLVTFFAWYRREGTLSIHSITTTPREAWYWLVVLIAFALGTAAGDLLIDRAALTPGVAVAIYAGAIALVYAAYKMGLGAITAFWIAYVLTRPLGGTLGDLLSLDKSEGGLGLGTLITSLAFLAAIVATVAYLTVTGRDRTELTAHDEQSRQLA